MVRACEVVADGFGRVRAEEDRARVFDLRGSRVVVARDDFEVFGREFVDEFAGRFNRPDDEGRAEIRNRARDDCAPRKCRRLPPDLRGDARGEFGAGRDEDGGSVLAVLGLREQIRGDEVGARAVVGRALKGIALVFVALVANLYLVLVERSALRAGAYSARDR